MSLLQPLPFIVLSIAHHTFHAASMCIDVMSTLKWPVIIWQNIEKYKDLMWLNKKYDTFEGNDCVHYTNTNPSKYCT